MPTDRERRQRRGNERATAFPQALHHDTMFKFEQINGLREQYRNLAASSRAPTVSEQAESFFTATGADFRHGCACVLRPRIRPYPSAPLAAFRDAESYAATKAYELAHWTGHASRNAREFGKRFGDRAYAFAELVAELGAAFLCARLAITPDVSDDHAAYLATWLRVLKDDKRTLFTAASHAPRETGFPPIPA